MYYAGVLLSIACRAGLLPHKHYPVTFQLFAAPVDRLPKLPTVSSRFTSLPTASSAQPREFGVEPNVELRWVPMIDPTLNESELSSGSTMPLFLLDHGYLPHTSPNIIVFEPRYRALFNDILFSGARRFLACRVNRRTGQIAEVGAILYLNELREISERTQGRAKYLGQHSVIGRARVLKVINPFAFWSRDTYLTAEVAELNDSDAAADTAAAEAALHKLMQEVIAAQVELGEKPRFRWQANYSFSRGTGPNDKGLWGMILQWQHFLRTARPRQRRFGEELDALDSDPKVIQAMLQSDSHAERLSIFWRILNKERKRLAARSTLQSMFEE
eukprot:gnl/TRDRNA2_/TRDRNA2_39020_c0_seq1.p1 gnl/TRDRNA2_/TRDRNA2_39020_c0~~gnl/TRDRNA2_/TRDRNA2_39020_c0_seq1.p1  ORF type:complete len:330 (+),score=45.93 gnl/TRDRNA2_/TRDRNA2_39020_c0_seq1:174-1163(+)